MAPSDVTKAVVAFQGAIANAYGVEIRLVTFTEDGHQVLVVVETTKTYVRFMVHLDDARNVQSVSMRQQDTLTYPDAVLVLERMRLQLLPSAAPAVVPGAMVAAVA